MLLERYRATQSAIHGPSNQPTRHQRLAATVQLGRAAHSGPHTATKPTP